MTATGIARAVNARIVPVQEYAPDPRGWGLFARLSGSINRGLVRAPAVIERSPAFHGWATTPQRFAGLAGASAGRQRPLAPGNSRLSEEKSAAPDDPALRLFAERLARR